MPARGGSAHEIEPNDEFQCPFHEFKDSEISMETPRSTTGRKESKTPDLVLIDELTQPLPLPMRRDVVEWMRAGDIAQNLWNAEIVVYDESAGGRFNNPQDCQLGYGSHIARSPFLRNLMSTCYALEMVENYQVEHQGEHFSFNMGSENWSARHHIYSQGVKAGGAANHKPTATKNGIYAVRLYYMGAWRRVPVSDAIPVDERGRPLLPLAAPRRAAATPKSPRAPLPAVELWPALLAKAVMRLAGEKYSYACDCLDHENIHLDEGFTDLDIVHSLTGWQVYKYDLRITGMTHDEMWDLISRHVPMFEWSSDDNKPPTASTTKSRSTKKTKTERNSPKGSNKCKGRVLAALMDTLKMPRFALPGLAPAHSHRILLSLLRDVPEARPPDEPEIPLWKTYRWYEWARAHGLYDGYECPRSKYISYKSLLKLSHAPHLHQVMSTESVTISFAHNATVGAKGKSDRKHNATPAEAPEKSDWVLFENVAACFTVLLVCLIPSANCYTAATSTPPPPLPQRATPKEPRIHNYFHPCRLNSSRNDALYMHLDTAEETVLFVSLETILPRLMRSYDIRSSTSDIGSSINGYEDYSKPGMLLIERSEWLDASLHPTRPSIFFETFGYATGRLVIPPGKHMFRIWIRSTIGYHLSATCGSGVLRVGTRASLAANGAELGARLEGVVESLGEMLASWVRVVAWPFDAVSHARAFYRLCTPDKEWDRTNIGYSRKYLPFMFQNALYKIIKEHFDADEQDAFKLVLQKMFLNPDIGLQGQRLNSIYVTRQSAKDMYKLLDSLTCDTGSEIISVNYEEYNPAYMDKTILRILTQIQRDEIEGREDVGEPLSECNLTMHGLKAFVLRYKAAEKIQAYYKGFLCRRMFRADPSKAKLLAEIIKMLNDRVFNNKVLISDVLRELFSLFPAVGSTFSISKELLETFKLQEYSGSVPSTFPPDVWSPLCKITFHCHALEIEVEMDLICDLDDFVMITFDNDTLKEIPRLSHSTLPHIFKRNQLGYTVLGYGWLSPAAQPGPETHWKLQIRSAPQAFRPADDIGPLTGLHRVSFRDIYVPNCEGVIAGAIIKVHAVSYLMVRFSTSYNKVEFEVVVSEAGEGGHEVCRWRARGAAVWPILQLHPNPSASATSHFDGEWKTDSKIRRSSRREMSVKSSRMSSLSRRESMISKKSTPARKTRKPITAVPSFSRDIKVYYLKVYVIRNSWPLTNVQWARIMRMRCAVPIIDSMPSKKLRNTSKSPPKKTVEIQPGDPIFHLEIAYDPEEGVSIERDMVKEQTFKSLQELWAAGDGRKTGRCIQIRKVFRDEFLQMPGICSSEHGDIAQVKETVNKKRHGARSKTQDDVSGRDINDNAVSENGSKYNTRFLSKDHVRGNHIGVNQIGELEDLHIPRFIKCPDCWLDHYKPIDFIDEVTIKGEETTLMTPELDLGMRERRREAVEEYEAEQVEFGRANLELLMRQKNRLALMARTFVDRNWRQEITESLDTRDQILLDMAEEQLKTSAAMKDTKKRKK